MSSDSGEFVGRAGLKLQAAIEAFGIDVRGKACADFGCNVGGFTDCLLRCGARKVYAVDTGYGQLAWRLRTDDRVVVMERTNALYCQVPEPVDLVAIDVAWTIQELIVPAAIRWLPPAGGLIVSLLKPHYELTKMQRRKPSSALSLREAQSVFAAVCRRLCALNCEVLAGMKSVLVGKGGNVEFFLLLAAKAM